MIKRANAGIIAAILVAFLCSANAQTFPGQAPVGAIPYWVTTAQIGPSICIMNSTGSVSCASSTSAQPTYTLQNNTVDTSSPFVAMAKTRNGGNSLSNDILGVVKFQGFANGSVRDVAAVTAVQTAASSGSNIPTRMSFQTSNISGLLNQNMSFDSNGHLNITQASPPTIGLGCNGAGSSIAAGSTDFAGQVIGQTAAATQCVVTFATPYTNIPFCVSTGVSTPITQQVVSTTVLQMTFASTGSQRINYICIGQ